MFLFVVLFVFTRSELEIVPLRSTDNASTINDNFMNISVNRSLTTYNLADFYGMPIESAAELAFIDHSKIQCEYNSTFGNNDS